MTPKKEAKPKHPTENLSFIVRPNAKGQMVIPAEIRHALDIAPGDTISIEQERGKLLIGKLLIRKSQAIPGPGQYIDVRSDSRPEVVHHVYTGDSVNGVHCTCEALRWGTREQDVLFVCKHLKDLGFGKGD